MVHLQGLIKEMATLTAANIDYTNRLFISDRAHIVFDFHQAIDGYIEQSLAGNKIGTTLKGIGPAYSSKVNRNGIRIGDLKDMEYFGMRLRGLIAQVERSYPGIKIDYEAQMAYYHSIREQILPMITDTIALTHDALDQGKNILVEGANATMIDLDFGTFPFVTSSNPSAGGACTGLGIPPQV